MDDRDDKIDKLLMLSPKKAWANPEEVRAHLEQVNKTASEDGFVSLVTIGETPTGSMYMGSSRVESKFALGAAMIMFALEIMGIRPKET